MPATLQPSCTGRFYPADPIELRSEVRRYLAEATPQAYRPKAIIAPHAGYDYSGPIAGSAYACVANVAQRVRQVILLGSCHVADATGIVTTAAEAVATPLGAVPIDRSAVDRLSTLEDVDAIVHDVAHQADHSLAVQLPFLIEVLADFQLVPFLAGSGSMASVAAVLDACWGGEETLIVVSSDLSHYHDYQTTCQLDRETADSIVALRPDRLDGNRACGWPAIGGLLLAAQQHRLQPELVDLRNSGDTAGPRDRVVGYGAFVFE